MRKRQYKCPKGCKLPPREKVLQQFDDGTWGYDYHDFSFCPCCGGLMPYSLDSVKSFFGIYTLHPSLKGAIGLVYKSEFEAAARETFVSVETVLKEKSGLDLHGFDLATKALSFEVDKQTGDIIRAPLISINDLKTDSDRNEQNGIRYMLMGFFQGPRNIYQHNHIGSMVSNVLSIITEASFLLYLLDGNSIAKHGHWIPVKVNNQEIYANMPRSSDRRKFVRMMKKRKRLQNKKH